MHRHAAVGIVLASFSLLLTLGPWYAQGEPATNGVSKTPTITAIAFEGSSLDKTHQDRVLVGPDARAQLVVSATTRVKNAQRPMRVDVSSTVTYSSQPAGLVRIDASGLITPLKDGLVTITAKHPAGPTCQAQWTITGISQPPTIDFKEEVVPIFTKFGCNGGGCHGKSTGQNGFKLSLLGFYPHEDYDHVVTESRGRRVFPAAPQRSLLITKAINQVPHGGGGRFDQSDPAYRTLSRWIAQGMPRSAGENVPTVKQIEVVPAQRTIQAGHQQQLRVLAHFSNNTVRDVTRTAQFESNDTTLVEASPTGKVTTHDQTGSAAVMVRYQGRATVFQAQIPMGAPVDTLPAKVNFIDDLVFNRLQELGVPPSKICDDSTFLRRVTLDIAGRLPTVDETKKFLKNDDQHKRSKLIDRLLASTDYAEHFTNKWSALLRNKHGRNQEADPTFIFHDWIRQSFHQNTPYDQWVRSILTASGSVRENPPVAWYREVDNVEKQVEDTAQVFLGMRIQCARCHHHPYEAWSQKDYHGLAAFFSRLKKKPGGTDQTPRVFHHRGHAQARNPRTGKQLPPTGLAGQPLTIDADTDPRQLLVDWMADANNPFFAKALVNRYWKHFFGRGLVDPVDDMRVTNPAVHPELLDALAQHFIKNKFDLKDLIRTICLSHTYQLSALPNKYNKNDRQHFSRYYPKRLSAEVLYDSLGQVTQTHGQFSNLPDFIGAVAAPLASTEQNYFLTVFGQPKGDSACECERTDDANLAQILHLINSANLRKRFDEGRVKTLAGQDKRALDDRVTELYLATFSRPPRPDELNIAQAYLKSTKNQKQAFHDLLWVLINSKEFLFNH